ncbi:DNA polymerase III subunit delta [Rhizobiales bacterium]|uniref:DNA polymerase III subunit delta n=1 Tax=Hongsoonwoonella zoysiae TaxID=2821844 RepID=UPI00155FDD7F|nr:DNA polymerase III subunit delta [Hongsoonwoonella zoysiae]NRG16831.1 DNA polymerase III subunit delta [Hongsoonwoonella zoysiae]
MVALKAQEIERFLAHPPESANLILIYGPDTGLVSERAQKLVTQATADNEDPFSLVKLDAADVAADPTRLIDEALTIPLFGGRRVIWVKDGGSKNLTPAVDTLLKQPGEMALVIIEAGDLKKGTGLRRRFESDKKAVALPCYADSARDVERLIEEEVRHFGLAISREAKQALQEHLGADRLASRGEIRKLCLYAHGKERIETADVDAVIGDASAFVVDELVDAVATGDLETIDHGIERLEETGQKPDIIANTALRHFQLLHRLRGLYDKGAPAAQIVGQCSPPIFFRRRDTVAREIGLWSREDLEKAIERLGRTVRDARLNQNLGPALLSDVFLTLGRVSRARRGKR